MSFPPLVLENEVIGAAPTYDVIRYLIIVWSGWVRFGQVGAAPTYITSSDISHFFGKIDQCRCPSRKDKD